MNNKQVIGKFIRRTRIKKGWSQTHLGDKIGIAHQTLSAIELGKHNIGIDTFFLILETLKADFEVKNGKII